MSIPVKIRIKSTIYNIDESAPESADAENEESSENIEKVEYTAKAELNEKNGVTWIKIEEPKELEMGNSSTTLSYNENNRKSMTVIREGYTSFLISLNSDMPLSTCTYKIFGHSTEFTVHTSKVYNTVKNGRGSILLDYSLLSCGVKIMRVHIFYEVENDCN